MATKPLTIKDWALGVGESPYVGFAQMVNVDIFTKPGCVKISNRMERDVNSVGVVTELIIWTAQDPKTGDVYGVDRAGQLYKRALGTTLWTVIAGHGNVGALGQGIAIWKDYLFYARSNRIDVYGLPSSANPGVWFNNWVGVNPSLISSDTHPMITSILGRADDTLYIGNANFVDTLYEVAFQTFDPANPATYAYSGQALRLKNGYKVVLLGEFGANIQIGTTFGFNGTFNIADTFFWDGFSEAISASQTTKFADDGVQMSINVGNLLYTIAGTGTPRIFKSVTSQAVEARKLNNTGDGNVRLFPAAINQKDGEVLFGIGQSLGAGGLNPMGIYSLRADKYVTRYLISTNNDGSSGVLMIGSVTLITANEIMVTWYDSLDPDVFGVDVLNINRFYTGNKAYLETPLYEVGTADDPTTYEKVQLSMGKKLRTGDKIRISGRLNLTDPYVQMAMFDNTYTGYDTVDQKVSNVSKFKTAQFLIELDVDTAASESLELKEITFT